MRFGLKAVILAAFVLLLTIPASAENGYVIGDKQLGEINGVHIDIGSSLYSSGWTQGADPYSPVGCTWFTAARVLELTGYNQSRIVFGCHQWPGKADENGWAKSTSLNPLVKSIACWVNPYDPPNKIYPHVAIVEGVTRDGKILISEGGGREDSNGTDLRPENGYCRFALYDSEAALINSRSGFVCFIELPVPAGLSDKFQVYARPRGTTVDLYWTPISGATYDVFLEYTDGSWSNHYSYPSGFHAQFGLSEGDLRATVKATLANGKIEKESIEFSLGKLLVSASSRGPVTHLSWNDYGADSYWVYVVTKDEKSVYSASVGKQTSVDLHLSDGDFTAFVTATINGQNVKTESAPFTVDSNLHISAQTKGSVASISWNDIGADSYWVYVVTKDEKSVYSASVGKQTSVDLHLSEGDFIAFVTATINGQNVKTESVPFTVDSNVHVSVQTKGSIASISWNDVGADSYWVYVVTKDEKSVYSASVGKQTSVDLYLSEGDYSAFVTATVGSQNVKTGSASFTISLNLQATVETLGQYAFFSWHSLNADEYQISIEGADGTNIHSSLNNKQTSDWYELQSGDYVATILAVKDGSTFQDSILTFRIDTPIASVDKSDNSTYRINDPVVMSVPKGMASFDDCSVKVYHISNQGDLNLVQEQKLTQAQYEMVFTEPGSYFCIFAATKSDISIESSIAYWKVIDRYENTLVLPNDTLTIESEAFSNLENEVNIVLSEDVSFISPDAFNGSTVLLIVPKGSYAEEYAKQSGILYLSVTP